jgi:hypothetical protein
LVETAFGISRGELLTARGSSMMVIEGGAIQIDSGTETSWAMFSTKGNSAGDDGL